MFGDGRGLSEVHQRTKLRECGRTGLTLLPISSIGRLTGCDYLSTFAKAAEYVSVHFSQGKIDPRGTKLEGTIAI
jgi:hypothetical protein